MARPGRKKFAESKAGRLARDLIVLKRRRRRGAADPTSLRQIAKELNAEGVLSADGKEYRARTVQELLQYREVSTSKKVVKKTQLNSGDFRSAAQVNQDRLALGGSPELLTIYDVLVSTGLRAAEFCSLRVADCDCDKRMINVLRGKGAKQRTVKIGKHVAAILKRCTSGKGRRQPVFTKSDGRALTYNDLRYRANRIKRVLGDPDFHCHVLRHTFATNLYLYKKDIIFLSEQLGHVSIETTRIYTKTLLSESLQQMDAMDGLMFGDGTGTDVIDSTRKPQAPMRKL